MTGLTDDTNEPAPPGSVDPATASTLTGRVRFEGTAPEPELYRIDGDRNCVSLNGRDTIPSERIVVGQENALANVFVYVASGLERYRFHPPAEPAVLDQKGCRYVPRVVGVMVGQLLLAAGVKPGAGDFSIVVGRAAPFGRGADTVAATGDQHGVALARAGEGKLNGGGPIGNYMRLVRPLKAIEHVVCDS